MADEDQDEDRASTADLASARSIKEHYSRIQMDYYGEPRQYDGPHVDGIKYPDRNELTGVSKNKLRFGGVRGRADVNVSQMKYQDQKEFFRLDREHD